MLGPDNTVNRLRRRIPDRTARIRFLRRFRSALIALGVPLLDQLHLAIVARRSALDQRHLRCEAHPIHVVSGGPIVQGVQHNVELLVEAHTVIGSGSIIGIS